MYQYLAQIGVSLAAKQTADARKTYDEMLTKYSEERLLGSSRMALMRTSANCSSRPKRHWSRLSKRRMQSRTTRQNNMYIM